jgi:2-C-methyl-D-erythritol 4-phosphate cytidylyltransferase
MSFVSAIVVAAGKGVRLRSPVPKALVMLKGKPLLAHSLEKFDRAPGIRQIIVAVEAGKKDKFRAALKGCRLRKPVLSVEGGRRRQDSVKNALSRVDARAGLVLIHDAARPLVSLRLIRAVIKEAKRSGAAVAGVPVASTLKRVKGQGLRVKGQGLRVMETLDRSRIWQIQTPQAFRRSLLEKAFRIHGNDDVTDDAMLVEKSGGRVSIVMGDYSNIKVTTPEDLKIAEALAHEL